MTRRWVDWWRRVGAMAALAIGIASCAGGGAPILETPRALPGTTVLLAPEVRVVASGDALAQADVAQLLQYELMTALDGAGISVRDGSGNETLAPLRAALVAAWQRQRSKGGGRYRAGSDLSLGGAADDPALRGTQSVILPVLTREGFSSREDGFMPLPPDHLPSLPESRPDYVVPQTGGAGGAVTLDLLVVELPTRRVVAQRRASFPARSPGDITAALSTLARETARGLTSGGSR